MVDLTAIAGAVSALNGAKEIAKAAISLRDANALTGKVWELNDVIIQAQTRLMQAQSEQATLVARVSELEEELAQIKEWNRSDEKYKLTDIGGGRFVQEYQCTADDPTPPHSLCANCYIKRTKSILQKILLSPGRSVALACHSCGSAIYTHGSSYPEHAAILRGITRAR